jgi:hypothetical protein
MPIASATPAASPSVISTGFILGGTEDTPAADEQQPISRRPEPFLEIELSNSIEPGNKRDAALGGSRRIRDRRSGP